MNDDEEVKLVGSQNVAYIAHCVDEDTTKEMQSVQTDQERDTQTLTAALPAHLRTVFFALSV